MDARICSEYELQGMDRHAREVMYQRVPFVYAHGKLESDMGTDIIYLCKGDYGLRNGLVAYTQDNRAVRFHLYRHPRTFELTGIVTYCDGSDKEAYEYGKRLVEERPDRF